MVGGIKIDINNAHKKYEASIKYRGGELTGSVVRRHVSPIQCLAQF